MVRSSFLLIAAIALASFFTEPAVGQFPIKVTIPKLPKKDSPVTTNTPDTVISTSDSSEPVRVGGDARGKPISGARITFSNSPDGSNPKTSFASSEYIYGKLDLGGRTVYDAF